MTYLINLPSNLIHNMVNIYTFRYILFLFLCLNVKKNKHMVKTTIGNMIFCVLGCKFLVYVLLVLSFVFVFTKYMSVLNYN